MKMPVGMPKVGKMPDWVKKRIEARKKAEQEGKKPVLPEVPQEDKEFAKAVNEIQQVAGHVQDYARCLRESPEQEMQSLLNALNGGFVALLREGMPCVTRTRYPPDAICLLLMRSPLRA